MLTVIVIPFKSFCGMYDPDADKHSNNQQNGAVSDHDNNSDSIDDDDA